MEGQRYLKTHPWLSFVFDPGRLAPTDWMLLGEAQSKCLHVAGVPLKPAISKEMHKVYLAKGALATTALEGNTLSEDQARKRLDGVLQLPPSKEYLGKEIDNVITAFNFILSAIHEGRGATLSAGEILEYNRLALDNLEVEEGVVPGEVRTHPVGVGRYQCPEARDCPSLLGKYVAWLNEMHLVEGWEIASGILKAIVAHIYLAWIHPFGDGNGRTARLIEYKILLSVGIPTPSAHILSNHYNQTRTQYYRELDKASKSGGDVTSFIRYALRGMVDGLKEQLDNIRSQQWAISWTDYIHERFKGQDTKAAVRRRRLMLDLSERFDASVEIARIPDISPRLAAEYHGATAKTYARDINVLVSMDLLEKKGKKIRARREAILAFLPHAYPASGPKSTP